MALLSAQSAAIIPERPTAPILWRPYLAPEVPPIRLTNTGRFHDLIRAGILYLTVQDAIALALENNIDIEISRYDPLISAWQLERAQAGGALPGVPSGASQAGSVALGQGVAGSQAAAGVATAQSSSTPGRSANATISQVGPVAQTLDPIIQEATTFSHTSNPQYNLTQSGTPNLIDVTHVYTGSYQQGFVTGGSVTVTYTEHYLSENAATDLLNPSLAPTLSFAFQHNLLRGFGVAVNTRTINISRINLKESDLNFQTQVISTVVNVLNQYYGMVADYEDVKSKQSALELAQTLYDDNKRQVEIGALAPLDVTSAESQVAGTQRDLVISQTSLRQQELNLKNLLSRKGVMDPELVDVRIMPVDRMAIPEKDNLPPFEQMVKMAMSNRPDLLVLQQNLKASEISALGTRNGVLPTVQVFGGESLAGLAGVGHTVITRAGVLAPDAYFVGGIGSALGQVFRRNFPTQRIGAVLQAPIENRQAQGDYGIDQLTLRQTELSNQKSASQAQVDLLNSLVAMQQARATYEAAVKSVALQKDLLDAEQKKLRLGASIPFNVVQIQRDLAAAQSTQIAALASYTSARIALDQATGATLQNNNVSITEAQTGKVDRQSTVSEPRQ